MKTLTSLAMLVVVNIHAQSDLHLMEGSVVRLKGSFTITESINGVDYEVWLKHPTNNAPTPKRVAIAGTGFLVLGKYLPFLVTARHVAQKMGSDCAIAVRDSSDQVKEFPLVEVSPTKAPLWVMDSTSDCAVHPIALTSQQDFDSRFKFVIMTSITNLVSDIIAPQKGRPLHMVGFPSAEGEAIGFSPSIRTANPETGLRKNAQGTHFFQLQLPGIDGYSGAPVFESGDVRLETSGASITPKAAGERKIWGLLSATSSDSSGGKMAIIIHASHIRRIIEAIETPIIAATATNASSAPAK